MELRIPRDRLGYFKPYLMAVLHDQEEEALRLALALNSKGLSQQETSDVLEEFYGSHYSKSSISRMTASLNEEVNHWLARPLDSGRYNKLRCKESWSLQRRKQTAD